MDKELKSLGDFNIEARMAYQHALEHSGNGIACPRCGMEMYDDSSMGIMLSHPPQMSVVCPGCKHRDVRVC